MRPFVQLALSLVLWGCDACSHEQPDGSPPEQAARTTLNAPEPWTMGAARKGELVLPPPCNPRGELLRAALPRDTRIASQRNTLGRLLVAAGGEAPMRQRAGAGRWKTDAAGLMTMKHGRTSVTPLPWPDDGPLLVARADGERWLLAVDRSDDSGTALYLWRDGELERLGRSPPLRAAALRCQGSHCALLSSRLAPDGNNRRAPDSGATLWLGEASEPAASWLQLNLSSPSDRAAEPPQIAALRVGDGHVTVIVALVDDLQAHFLEVSPPDEIRHLVSLGAPHGVLDTIAAPQPTVLGRLTGITPSDCETKGGGVTVVTEGREPVTLRAAAATHSGALHALAGGLLVTWLAPARCGSPRQRLHAVVLRSDGTPVAPVTVVAEADQYAVATEGNDLDLWIRRSSGDGEQPGGGGRAGTVSWLPAHCNLPHPLGR